MAHHWLNRSAVSFSWCSEGWWCAHCHQTVAYGYQPSPDAFIRQTDSSGLHVYLTCEEVIVHQVQDS